MFVNVFQQGGVKLIQDRKLRSTSICGSLKWFWEDLLGGLCVWVWVGPGPQSVSVLTLFVGLLSRLRQQSPCPVPVLQTGGGVEWDRRAASTNISPSAAWLTSLVGVQPLPASGM